MNISEIINQLVDDIGIVDDVSYLKASEFVFQVFEEMRQKLELQNKMSGIVPEVPDEEFGKVLRLGALAHMFKHYRDNANAEGTYYLYREALIQYRARQRASA